MENDCKTLGGERLALRRRHQTTLPILDSKHISPTLKLYNIKLVECGEYVQVYLYKESKIKNKKEDNSDLKLINTSKNSSKVILKKEVNSNNEIELRSIIRSKLECQRLAKSNVKSWETFITLTFADNVTDINFANKKFRYFIDKIRRVNKNFKYLCIPEFQKRGAVHYHMLCNIKINDNTLLYEQEDNKKFKHIKYWNEGFTSIEPIKNDAKKIVGYISKYMTKDIDNRLFSKHRYFYSQNLVKPKENYINLNNEIDKNFYNKKIQDLELIYQNEYINPYDNNRVTFLEFNKN